MTIDPRRNSRLQRFLEIDLYPVTCEALSAGRTDEDVLEGFLEGGAGIVQLRDKTCSRRRLYEKAVHFRRRTSAFGALLIINDHIDIAMAVDADGVHLGQDDFPLEAARRLLPDRLIGISSHNLREAQEAEAGGADYCNIGPIYPTGTKAGLSEYLGPDAVRQIGGQLHLPFTTMGGIKLDNLADVLSAGARRVAVVTALTQASDVPAAVRLWKTRIQAAG